MKKTTLGSILTTVAVCAAYDLVKFAAKKGYEYLKFQEEMKKFEEDDEDFDDDFDFDDFDDVPGSGDTNYEKVSSGADAVCAEDDEDPLEGLDIYLNGPKKEEKDGNNTEKENDSVHNEDGDESGEGNSDNSAGNDNTGDAAGDDESGESESVEKEEEKNVQ